jgi:hypothetical protein
MDTSQIGKYFFVKTEDGKLTGIDFEPERFYDTFFDCLDDIFRNDIDRYLYGEQEIYVCILDDVFDLDIVVRDMARALIFQHNLFCGSEECQGVHFIFDKYGYPDFAKEVTAAIRNTVNIAPLFKYRIAGKIKERRMFTSYEVFQHEPNKLRLDALGVQVTLEDSISEDEEEQGGYSHYFDNKVKVGGNTASRRPYIARRSRTSEHKSQWGDPSFFSDFSDKRVHELVRALRKLHENGNQKEDPRKTLSNPSDVSLDDSSDRSLNDSSAYHSGGSSDNLSASPSSNHSEGSSDITSR